MAPCRGVPFPVHPHTGLATLPRDAHGGRKSKSCPNCMDSLGGPPSTMGPGFGVPKSAEPPARVRAEPSRGTRCLGTGAAPLDYTCRAGGAKGCPAALHPGRSRCAPTAVATAPVHPQTLGTPRSLFFTCAAWLVAPCGLRQSPPCHGLAGTPAQTWLLLPGAGIVEPELWLSLARVLRQERQSPSAERVRSRLAAGLAPAGASPPFPALDLLCQGSGAHGAAPNSTEAITYTDGICRDAKAPDTTRKAIKSLQRCCSHPPSVPLSLVQLSKCFMVLIPVALSTGVVLITYTFQRANADHVPRS